MAFPEKLEWWETMRLIHYLYYLQELIVHTFHSADSEPNQCCCIKIRLEVLLLLASVA